jgi:hypothetical protein
MKKFVKNILAAGMITASMASAGSASAQTDMDAIMMNKKQFCQGLVYDYSSWDHYWEGTFKRDNENLGTVSTQMGMYMPNYGITNNLNVMASVPYVWTKASEGVLHGMKGFQDLSVFVKWRPLVKSFGENKFSLFAVGGVTTPLSDYVIEFLPMSIGLGSTNLIARGMIDYRRGIFTATGSAAYIAEALLTNMTTHGGYDITKNNGQLYPNLRMNSTMVGANIKYTIKSYTNLSVVAGANYTIAGRNVGQSKTFNVGAFYVFYVGKKAKS